MFQLKIVSNQGWSKGCLENVSSLSNPLVQPGVPSEGAGTPWTPRTWLHIALVSVALPRVLVKAGWSALNSSPECITPGQNSDRRKSSSPPGHRARPSSTVPCRKCKAQEQGPAQPPSLPPLGCHLSGPPCPFPGKVALVGGS